MDSATFREYLEKRYFDQMEYYSKASSKNQKKYKNFQWILIILSTLTTIMAAMPRPVDGKGFDFQYAIVISAAVVTILTSALKTFQYQELWVTYRTTNEQLKPEIYYYQFNVGEYGKPGVDKESLFVTHVESILSKEHSNWPAYKKMEGENGKGNQQIDEMQKKLDDLVRGTLNTQRKDASTGDTADTATDALNDATTETATDATTENIPDTTTDALNDATTETASDTTTDATGEETTDVSGDTSDENLDAGIKESASI